MGASSRTKGHNFERWVAAQLRDIYPGARRGLQYQDGPTPPDVVGTPFHVECKVGQRPNPRAALQQACDDTADGMVPVAVVKDDRKNPIVVMRWYDWLDLIEEWNERGEK